MRKLAPLFSQILLTVTACEPSVDTSGVPASDTLERSRTPTAREPKSAQPSASSSASSVPLPQPSASTSRRGEPCSKVAYCDDDQTVPHTLRERCLPDEAAVGTCTMDCESAATMMMCVQRGPCDDGPGPVRPLESVANCNRFNRLLPCDLDTSVATIPKETCDKLCPQGTVGCGVTRDAGKVLLSCSGFCGVGRFPQGYAPVGDSTDVGAYLALASQMECASAHAFDRFARELDLHGAPRHLVEQAERGIEQERQHANKMARLATRFGGEAISFTEAPMPTRPLRDVALENAVEGAVREGFGALLLAYQANHAEDSEVRRTFQQIADDEMKHAELAWDVVDWVDQQLDAHDRDAMHHALRVAAREVGRDETRLPAEAQRALGLPSQRVMRELAEHWRAALGLTHAPDARRPPRVDIR